jgi:hypothetical protein
VAAHGDGVVGCAGWCEVHPAGAARCRTAARSVRWRLGSERLAVGVLLEQWRGRVVHREAAVSLLLPDVGPLLLPEGPAVEFGAAWWGLLVAAGWAGQGATAGWCDGEPLPHLAGLRCAPRPPRSPCE